MGLTHALLKKKSVKHLYIFKKQHCIQSQYICVEFRLPGYNDSKLNLLNGGKQ